MGQDSLSDLFAEFADRVLHRGHPSLFEGSLVGAHDGTDNAVHHNVMHHLGGIEGKAMVGAIRDGASLHSEHPVI